MVAPGKLRTWHEVLGGRKFLLTLIGIWAVLRLAELEADGNAYLALGGIIMAFSGANAAIEKFTNAVK